MPRSHFFALVCTLFIGLTVSGLLAADGLEGLELYRERAREIDLVIMPNMGFPQKHFRQQKLSESVASPGSPPYLDGDSA